MKWTHSRRIASTAPEDLGGHVKPLISTGVAVALFVLTMAASASAQATGGLTGSVVDTQGGAIPGATVVLSSETKGTTLGTTVTSGAGVFVFPNLPPDRYTVTVEIPSFKKLQKSGFDISSGPVTSIGKLTIEIGGAAETVIVKGEVSLVQAVSGEKSFTVTNQQMASLPILGRDFGALLQLTPGVQVSTDTLTTVQVLGGAGQTTFMVDGAVNMDPGINRQSMKVSVDSVSEVKAVTSSYQAEYGRSAGMQVNVVTKSGTNDLRGGLYYVARNSDWNSNSKTNILNGDPKPLSNEKDYGGSLGGPVGKPGHNNKLFFFFNLEFNPRTRAGSVVSYRMPTLLERQGDFSQTLDNNGNLYPYIKDPLISGTCSAANTTACFKDGGVLGKIPANRLYQTGLNILKWYPEPNLPTVAGVAYNYQTLTPKVDANGYAPVLKLDYQALSNLRASARVAIYQQPTRDFPQNIPGFTDITVNNIGIYGQMYNVNWSVNSTTYVEVNYSRNSHAQSGCSVPGGSPTFCGSQGGLATSPKSNRNDNGMGDLPYIFPDAFNIDPSYWAYQVLNSVDVPWWDGTTAHMVPSFAWGSRVTNAPPNIAWAQFIQTQITNGANASVTKVKGRHTMKAGFSFIQSVQTDGRSSMQGTYTFGNDTLNPLDSQFGFSNAALGVFSNITQTSRWTEGANNSRTMEGYLQDNWKIKPNLTLDFGMRFSNYRAVFDERGQGSNFLPNTYDASKAPALYQYGCANGVYPCSGTNRVAINPLTGQQVGTSAQASVIVGTLVPNTGNALNGLHIPGTDIAKTYYKFPSLVLGPRWGVAWDVTGQQKFVVRGGGGIFYDRTQTQESYTVVNNPPTSQTVTVRYGYLQDLSATGLATVSPSALRTFEYTPKVPTALQWNGGVQMVLPWAMTLDASYTGSYAWNKWTSSQNINSIDIGAGFDPALQDPSSTTTGVAGSLVSTNPNQVRFYKGYGAITQITFNQWEKFHSIQISLQRRMRNHLAFGFVDTIQLYDRAKISDRFQHDYANRTVTDRTDQAQAQALLGNQNPSTHQMKVNFIYELPRMKTGGSLGQKILGGFVNDWQVSGIWTGITATPYTITPNYTSGGGNLNLTGSPDFAARVLVIGDPGQGCSSDPLRQFNAAAFQGPAVGSVGLESGNNYVYGCFQQSLDLSINKTISLGGRRNVQLRLDIFNAPNFGNITGRNTTMNLNSPSTPTTITNLPFDASGNVIDSKSKPRGAGFGVATGYQTARSMQFTARFSF
ncbi:MAG: TonB-dependent receptor [Acidobacteria bacterium]|nr:TonB-dependent receptor [Acidobacteriota bacterium]